MDDHRFWKVIAVAFLATVLFLTLRVEASYAAGYVSTPCGFDIDDDYIPGESSTCSLGTCTGGLSTLSCSTNADCSECNFCDGVTTDPDRDGDPEDLIYVDCNSGSDTGAGTPGNPYRTIGKALSVADGPGVGHEDIICVRATCATYNGSLFAGTQNYSSSTQTLTVSGVASTPKTKTASGNENFNFDYPTDPFMLIAWDTDNDGEYPPYDTDQPEPFVLDACTNAGCTSSPAAGTSYGLGIGDASDIEIAHMTIRNYGRGRSNSDTYSLGWIPNGSGLRQRNYIHDIEIENSLYQRTGGGEPKTIRMSMNGGNYMRYFALENIKITNSGGWIWRAWMGKVNNGALLSGGAYLRLNKFSIVSPWYEPGGGWLSGKTWSGDYQEYINSRFVGTDVRADPTNTNHGTKGIFVNKNSQYVWVKGNEFVDIQHPITVGWKDNDSFGDTKDIVIEGNSAIYTPNGPFSKRCRNGGSLGQACASNTDCGSGNICGYDQGEIEVISLTPQKTDGNERTQSCPYTCNPEPCLPPDNYNAYNIDCFCIQSGGPYYLGRTDVRNNFVDFGGATNIRAVLRYQNGSNCPGNEADAGPLYVANNTVKNFNPIQVRNDKGAFVFGGNPVNSYSFDFDFRYVPGAVHFDNNIVEGNSGGHMVRNKKVGADNQCPLSGACYYDGSNFSLSNNRYVASPNFVRGASAYSSLANWQAATGTDSNSKTYGSPTATTCQTSYQADGLHLAAADTCALEAGNNSKCAAKDFDRDTRPIGTCDIGADEYVTVGSQPGVVQWENSAYSVSEPDGTITVYVVRANGTDGAAQVDYATAPGTATGAADCTGAGDYINKNGTLTWSDTEGGSKSFSVTICDDAEVEANQAFTIVLSNPQTVGAGSPMTTTVTILSEDQPPEFAPTVYGPSSKSACTTANGDTLTIPSVSVPSGPGYPNKVLIVAASAYSPGAGGDLYCDFTDAGVLVTWNGHILTLADTVQGFGVNGWGLCSAIFYWLNPEAGATSNVVIDLNEAVATDIKSIDAAALVIYNAAQFAPDVGVYGSAWDAETPLDSPITVTRPQSLLVDAAALSANPYGTLGGGNLIPGGGQSEIADLGSCWLSNYAHHLGVSVKAAPAVGDVSMVWSWQTGTVGREAHTLTAWASDSYGATTTTTTSTTTTNTNTTTTTLAVNKRGRIGVGRILRLCESSATPSCNGTCPVGEKCVQSGGQCECQ